MKIYTLRIVYSTRTGDIHEIEEMIEEEDMHYRVGDMDLEDLVTDEDLMDRIRMEATEVASG